jgi:hypothetical protein
VLCDKDDDDGDGDGDGDDEDNGAIGSRQWTCLAA